MCNTSIIIHAIYICQRTYIFQGIKKSETKLQLSLEGGHPLNASMIQTSGHIVGLLVGRIYPCVNVEYVLGIATNKIV